jgi:hypothetical protein
MERSLLVLAVGVAAIPKEGTTSSCPFCSRPRRSANFYRRSESGGRGHALDLALKANALRSRRESILGLGWCLVGSCGR